MIIWYFELSYNDILSLLRKSIDFTVDSGLGNTRVSPTSKLIHNFVLLEL